MIRELINIAQHICNLIRERTWKDLLQINNYDSYEARWKCATSTNIYGFEFVRVCEGIRGGNCKLSTARLRKMMDRGRLNRCFFTFRTRTLLRIPNLSIYRIIIYYRWYMTDKISCISCNEVEVEVKVETKWISSLYVLGTNFMREAWKRTCYANCFNLYRIWRLLFGQVSDC